VIFVHFGVKNNQRQGDVVDLVLDLIDWVEKLVDQVKKNSANSSKPPSSDRSSGAKPKQRSLRGKSEKKPVGLRLVRRGSAGCKNLLEILAQ
jgi:hypothetical protein